MIRWITGIEIDELVRRCKTIPRRQGKTVDTKGSDVVRFTSFHGVSVVLHDDDRVEVNDRVAGVLEFDYTTEGIQGVYGGTARKVLLKLRENMVLDDLASIADAHSASPDGLEDIQ